MSRKGHIPTRLCIGCKKRKRKEEMIRFTLTADGRARIAEGRNIAGRGVYVCPDTLCLKSAKKRHDFEPFFETAGFESGFEKKSDENKTAYANPFRT